MADNVFRVTTIATMYGQQIQNVLHFSGPSSDPLEMSNLANEVVTGWINKVRERQISQHHYSLVRVKLLESQFPTFEKVVDIGGARVGGDGFLTFVANIIRIRTAIAGKHGRGRVYIGGMENAVTNQGFLRQDHLDNWEGNLNGIRAAFLPGGTSTFRLGVTRKVAPVANFIEATSISMAPVCAVQRRRNIGVGI